MEGVQAFLHDSRAESLARDRALASIAARQHGVVARRQLAALGYGRGAISHRLRTARLHRVHQGVYAVGRRQLTRTGVWMAAVLACGPGALLSHRSAAALWRLAADPSTRVDVTVAIAGRGARPGIDVHVTRTLLGLECAQRDGIPVTSVARTLLDLAEVVGGGRLARAVEEAERLRLLDLRQIEALSRRAFGRRGVPRLEAALADFRPPALTRSELERRFLRLLEGAGLPRPAVNAMVAGLEVDMAWRSQRLVVELDSYSYHRTRAAFERDRARDTTLQLAGQRVLRLTSRRIDEEPAAITGTLRALLAFAPTAAAEAGTGAHR